MKFPKGTVVIHQVAEVAIVVGSTRAGWPILRGVSRYGAPTGQRWSADPSRCERYASLDEAFTASHVRRDLHALRLRAQASRERYEAALAVPSVVVGGMLPKKQTRVAHVSDEEQAMLDAFRKQRRAGLASGSSAPALTPAGERMIDLGDDE